MNDPSRKSIAIIGAGPAGLMAAEYLSARGFNVDIFERKPTAARKFLMAGLGGLNLTHGEDLSAFMRRYARAADFLSPAINTFTPADLRNWAAGLGEETFTGTSGRVFPKSFKASPLLRAWQKRLMDQGVKFHANHDWTGWTADGALSFGNGSTMTAAATLLALGGGSWPRLGSDGSWVPLLREKGIGIAPLAPANCGFHVAWSEYFRNRHAGEPLKNILLTGAGSTVRGEAMIDARGIEGGAVYALSRLLRAEIGRSGTTVLKIDLRPDIETERLAARLAAVSGTASLSNRLRKAAGLTPLAISLLREGGMAQDLAPDGIAAAIKNVELTLTAPFGIDRAISSAGGVMLGEVEENFMLKKMPGVFVAGEMLDWEAPTGGYLLQATFSTAVAAAKGMADFLQD